ncbi:hypothetical protein HZH66_013772 [Vespula vulgaris]|uniref:Odorant receptor n=1 Tax=Vespula vulgaris TaxID=7454 RepID=A0A834MSJ7_VESVU|nr:hypothetical protein HZH66_013772 [Vespula vulgaris]
MYGSGILFRGIIPLTKGKITINENFTIRPLPCPCYFLFFDPQLSPAYEIVYFLQCLSGMVTYSITTAICGLAAFLIMHICGQLEILVTLMERIVEKTDLPSENVHAKIALAVEHQIRVRSFLRAVEHTLQQICLIEIMGCTLMVCMLAYNIMTEWTNRNFAIVFMYSIALSSIICNIFILCYIGEQLTLQAEKVARKSCTLDWYNLPAKKLSDLVLMIAISNRPMKITAGNIFGLSFQTFGNVIKTAATYCNMLRAVTSEKIRTCLKHIREDWTKIILQEDHELMMSQARIGRILSTMSICFIYGAGIFYRTFLPLSKGSVVVGNRTIRPLACPSYFVLFDEQKSPAYELVFFGQFLGGFTVYTVGSGVCGLAAFFIMHVCGQLGILMRKMNDIVEGNYSIEKNPKIRIAEVIRHQIRTRSFVKEVEEILQYPCMAEIMGCTSLVCLVLYYLVMEWEDSDATGLITFVLLFVSFAFNMFIFCYIGELLSEQGAKVGLTSSTLNWHCLPVKDMKCLIPVIIMSNYPLKIVAGKLMDMSLSNFNNIIKTAVGYFNILRNSV